MLFNIRRASTLVQRGDEKLSRKAFNLRLEVKEIDSLLSMLRRVVAKLLHYF